MTKDQATAPLPELTGVRGNIIFVQEQGIVPVRSFGTKSFRPDVELQLLVENSSAPFDIQRRGRIYALCQVGIICRQHMGSNEESLVDKFEGTYGLRNEDTQLN